MMLNAVMSEYFQSVRKIKHSRLSWESHQRRTHAHTWNQPTNSHDSWQMLCLWMFKVSLPGYVDRVERRLPIAIADTGRCSTCTCTSR